MQQETSTSQESSVSLSVDRHVARCETLANIGGIAFTNISILGEGGFGKVFLIETDHEKRAMKVVDKSTLSYESCKRTRLEREILQKMSDSEFFVGLQDYYENMEAHVFVLNYCSGGDLRDRLIDVGTFDEDTARFYIGEIAVAVGLLHGIGYIHRDLKLNNILINADGHIVLADFGLSKAESDSKDMDCCGTSSHMAPEILKKKDYNSSIDIWAMGIMVFRMLTGYHPFRKDTDNGKKKMEYRIKGRKPNFPKPNYLSFEATNFINSLLNKDPNHRPYACSDFSNKFKSHELKANPFFKFINWGMLENRLLPPPYVPPLEEP